MISAHELRAQLEDTTQDLWWSSESDYPISVIWQPPAEINAEINADQVRQLAGCGADAPIQVVALEDFFARAIVPQSWHTPEDKANIAQLKKLKALLTESLNQVQVYRCGEIEVSVYIVGVAPNGSVAGVKTVLIET
jgi:hypothetical protein